LRAHNTKLVGAVIHFVPDAAHIEGIFPDHKGDESLFQHGNDHSAVHRTAFSQARNALVRPDQHENRAGLQREDIDRSNPEARETGSRLEDPRRKNLRE